MRRTSDPLCGPLKRKWPKVVEVDGQPVVDQRRGLAIVATLRFGMIRPDAKPDDGLLDVVFLADLIGDDAVVGSVLEGRCGGSSGCGVPVAVWVTLSGS